MQGESKVDRRTSERYTLAVKHMDTMTKVSLRVAAVVLWLLDVGLFIRTHFMGPPHTEGHTVIGAVLEYGPFTFFFVLSIALFARPEETVRLFLSGIDRGIKLVAHVVPLLRIFRRKDTNGG